MRPGGSNVVAFAVIDIDLVEAVVVDYREALRCGMRVSAARSRHMTKLDAKTERCQGGGFECQSVPVL
jgi:hypothetical protein